MVGLTALGCAGRTFEDDELGDTADEVDSSSSSESSTNDASSDDESLDSPNDWEGEGESSGPGTESTSDSDSSTDESTSDTSDIPGTICTSDEDCAPFQCYVLPFLGGWCGECNEDADCPDGGGCTPPSPFESSGSVCNMGEFGSGCESTDVCMPGLVCGTALDLLGLIQINSCGTCTLDSECMDGQICASLASLAEFEGVNDCIAPNSLPQDAFCTLEGNGNQACASGLCSTLDIMGLAQIGACGECNSDADCLDGTCVAGVFDLDFGTLTGSTCQ